MVIGGDSCLRGHEFESMRWILDRSFFTIICISVWEIAEANEKEAGLGMAHLEKAYKN